VVTLEDNDLVHMVKGDYTIFLSVTFLQRIRFLTCHSSIPCRVVTLEDNDLVHMVKGDYTIFLLVSFCRKSVIRLATNPFPAGW